MKSYSALAGLVLMGLASVGCSGDKVPEPKAPEPPTLSGDDDLMGEIPENKPLESGIIVKSSEEGVEIRIDGEVKGKTPLEVVVEPGTHEVVFVFSEDNQVTHSVEVGEGQWPNVYQALSPDASDAMMKKKDGE